MAQITIKQLEAFVQVADMESFRRAAEKLGTTQPNISARISSLETQLGVTLMERDAGSVRLTAMGSALLSKARTVIRSVDAFLVATGDDLLFEGVLRLGVTEMVVHSWLGAYLSALKEKFPNIDVELTVDLSANLSDALFNRSIDLALQSGPFNRQTSASLDLGSFELIWVASPDLNIGSDVLSLQDLAINPILTHAKGTLPYKQLSAHFAGSPDVTVRLVPSTNIAACLQMTLQGLGVACLPEAMVRREIAKGKLTDLRYPWRPEALGFHARYDADTAPTFVTEAAGLAKQISRDTPRRG